MIALLVLAISALGIGWLLRRDVQPRASVSPASWFVVAWAAIFISRPVTSWFSGTGPGSPESYDEGTPAEALIYLALIVGGLIVLLRRRIELSAVIRSNGWLAVFYLFWLLSVLWSDYPLITVKRLVKDLGNVIMVLIVLTGRGPDETLKAVFTRCAYVCVPLSVVLIRYFPDLGRVYSGYDRSETMFVGVAAHKNTLGTLALVGALFVLWDLLQTRGQPGRGSRKTLFAVRLSILSMSWYLLIIADSATSLVCAVFGSVLLVAFSRSSIQRRLGRVEAFSLGAALTLWMLDSLLDLKRGFVQILGRDMTLTTRTDVWPVLLSYQDSVAVGAGFNSFWAGHRLVQLQDSVGGIIQAHNGYLETYLNGGLVGVALLVLLLISGYRRLKRALVLGASEASLRLVLLALVIIHNFSEASFNKLSILWVVAVFALMDYRARPRAAAGVRTGGQRPSTVRSARC